VNMLPVGDRIPRNEAIEIYGTAKFRAAWVGERGTEEYELTQKYKIVNGMRPPVPSELVDALYVAEERAVRQDRQYHEAILWLENHGMDCVRGLAEGLDRKTFEAAFAREFGRAPSSITRTRFLHPSDAALIQEALNALAEGKVSNAYQADGLVYKRAEGQSPTQNRDRLRKAIARQWQSPKIAKDT